MMDINPSPPPSPFCEMLKRLGTGAEGLSSAEASQRITRHGLNLLKPSRRSNVLRLLLAQFKSPIILILLFILEATQDQFRTGWFLESVVSASLIVLVVRSRNPSFRSRPSKYLLLATLLTVVVTVVLPFTPLGGIFGFSHLTIPFLLLIAIIVILYIVSAEVVKSVFYRSVKL